MLGTTSKPLSQSPWEQALQQEPYIHKYFNNMDILLAWGKTKEALDKLTTYINESQDDEQSISAHKMSLNS